MGSENSKSSKPGGGNTPPESVVITTRQATDSNGSNRNAGIPPAIKVGNSTSCNENLLNAGLPQQTDSKLTIDNSRSRSGSASGSPNKQVKKPTMTLKSRQLIQSCFQNPHENLGRRILKRTAEKRKDFGKFYVGLNAEQKDDVEETTKTLLKKSVANVEFMDEVQRLAEEFGERFVQYRSLSFKADYFSSIADATITECVFLDNAVHPAHLTLSAFSQFITALFSAVRDGFYNEMKRLRRTSNSFSTGSNGSARRGNKASIDSSRDATPSPRSSTPEVESISHNSQGSSSVEESPEVQEKTSIVQEKAVSKPSNELQEPAKSPETDVSSPKAEVEQPDDGLSLIKPETQEAIQERMLPEDAKEVAQRTMMDAKEVVDKVIIDSTKKVIIDSTCSPREAVRKVIIDSIIVDSNNTSITAGND